MLRRLLFFFIFLFTTICGFSQTFTLEAEQSLSANKDSLVISLYVQSSADDQLGDSDFVFDIDTNALFLNSGTIDETGSPYSDNASYDSVKYNFNPTFGYFNITVRRDASLTNPGGPNVLAASRTKIADIYLEIREKCFLSGLDWRSSAPTGAIQKWTGPVATNKVSTTPFILRDSIGGTVVITALSDTLCQGADVDIAFLLNGEAPLNVRFGNGTDSYLAGGLDLADPAALYTPTITGEAIYTIDSIQDVNGCWVSTSLNFVDDTAFIDATVPLANAGTDDSICVPSKTYTLNGNDPTIAFNGVWKANSTGAVFVDNSQFSTDVTVDTGGYYYFTWTISSLIDGATGACPSEEDSVRIRFFRQPSPAIIDSATYNLCAGALPATILNIAANALDTGVGLWTVISAPGGAIGPFFSDPANDTTDFTSNVQGSYDVRWEITNGNCPATSDNVLINFELPAQDPVINTLDDSQCAEIANLNAQNIPLVGNLEFWSTTSSAVIAGTTSPITTATLPTYTSDSTFTFYWNSQNTTVPGVCPTKQDSVKITRFAQPDTTASLDLNNTTPACGGVETYTISNVVAGSNYNWILPGGFNITNSNADSTFIDVTLDDPSFAGDIIIIENTPLGCSGGVDTLFVIPTGCQFEASFRVLPNDTVCVGDEVTLISNTAGSIPGSTQYQWDSAETAGFVTFIPLTTDADTALATFNDPGNWQIRMTASEPTIPPNPIVDDTTINIVVLAPPSANFTTSSASPICIGDTLKFVVDITGGAPPFTLEIDTLGGGLPITINNYTSGDTIRIVPTQGTSYLLSSVSDNFSCSGGSITGGAFPFVVNALPTLSITTPAFPDICLGDSISIGFSAPGALPYNNVYINSAGGQEIVTITSDPENLFFTPTADGLSVYSIDSVEDSNGCVSTSAPNISGTATVTVNNGIDSAQFTGADIICIGENDTLTIEAFGGAGPYDYFLTNTTTLIYNNEASPFNFIETPLTNTTYTLDSVIDNFGCVVSPFISQTTIVNPLPTATISGAAWICEGDVTPITFSGSLASDTIYYSANGVAQGTQVGPGVVPVSPTVTTNYTIDSVISASGCTVSDPNANITGNPVQVFVNPAITSAVLLGGDTICEGETDNIYANIVGGTGQFSLSLDTGGAWTLNNYNSGDSIPIITGATLTTTLLSVTDDSTCTFVTPSSTTTTVNQLAFSNISVVAGGDTICSDGSSTADIEITLSGTGGPYDVTISDGVTPDTTINGLLDGTTTISLNPSSGSAFDSVKYFVVNVFDNNSNCLVDSSSSNVWDTVTFYLIQPYTGTITPTGTTDDLCFGDNVTLNAGGTAGYTSLQWLYGGNPIAGETSASITVDYTGVFTLEAGISACLATSDTVAVLVAPEINSSIAVLPESDTVFCENDTAFLKAPAIQGNAVSGTAPGSYVQTNFNGLPGNESRTVEAWIKSTSANAGIIGYGTGAISGGGILMHINNNGGAGVVGALRVSVRDGFVTGTTPIDDGNYHHVAFTFSGTNATDIKLYVDGEPEVLSGFSPQAINTDTTGTTDLRIGPAGIAGIVTPLPDLDGLIDEVRFWNIALDDSSIFNNYNIPLQGSEPGLIGLWNFEDTTNSSIKDETGGSTPGNFVSGGEFSIDSGFYTPSPTATYEWFINAVSQGVGTDPFYNATSGGDYTVLVSNDNCNSLSAPVTIREAIQNPNITAGGPTNLCFGDNVLLSATGQTSLEDSTIWHYASNPIVGANTSTLIADASGGYSIVFYDKGCSDTSNVILVDVAVEIDTSLTVDGDTALCEGDTTYLSVPLYGGNNLRASAKNDDIRNIGVPGDYDFIHQRGQFTIQYWQRLNNPGANKINVAVGNSYNGTEPGFFAGAETGGAIPLNRDVKLHIDADGTGNPFVFRSTGSPFVDTDWHQITISVDSADATIYFDGIEIPSSLGLGTINYLPNASINPLSIGNAANNPIPFNPGITNDGGVDEVRIWNIPLDSTTIANNWNRPLNGNEPGLVALFDLDEDTSLNAGDNVVDIVSGSTGVLNGGAEISNSTNSMPSDSLVYQWYRDGLPIAGADSNVLAVTSTGDYYVEISTADLGCSDVSRTITINDYSIDPQVTVNSSPACFGDPVDLTATNISGALDSVRWYYGNYLVDSISNPYSATLSGIYRAELFNNICSVFSDPDTIEISKAIDNSLFVRGDTVLCEGDEVVLAAPKYGSNSLRNETNTGRVNNFGTNNSFNFIHESEQFSAEFWLKLDAGFSGVQAIAGNANSAGERGFNLVVFNGRIRLRMFNGTTQEQYFSNVIFNAGNVNNWNHVALSFKNDTAHSSLMVYPQVNRF